MKSSGTNLLKLLFDCVAKQKVEGSLESSEIIPSRDGQMILHPQGSRRAQIFGRGRSCFVRRLNSSFMLSKSFPAGSLQKLLPLWLFGQLQMASTGLCIIYADSATRCDCLYSARRLWWSYVIKLETLALRK